MIDIQISRTYQGTVAELFGAIDTVHKLAAVKPSLGRYRTARDEAGLQIIDTALPYVFLRLSTRLRYTTNTEKYCELEQIKGSFSAYSCRYTFRASGASVALTVRLMVSFPLGPIGFLLGLLFAPLEKFRLSRELSRIDARMRSARP